LTTTSGPPVVTISIWLDGTAAILTPALCAASTHFRFRISSIFTFGVAASVL
jgi:hypothetical protein